jgi:hypothetical protein
LLKFFFNYFFQAADTAYRTETAAKWSDRDRADADRLVAHNLAEKRRQAEIDSMKADHELQLQSLKAELPVAAAAAAQALADAQVCFNYLELIFFSRADLGVEQALAAQQHRVEIERVRAECSAAASESIAAVMNVKNDAEARVKHLQAEVRFFFRLCGLYLFVHLLFCTDRAIVCAESGIGAQSQRRHCPAAT